MFKYLKSQLGSPSHTGLQNKPPKMNLELTTSWFRENKPIDANINISCIAVLATDYPMCTTIQIIHITEDGIQSTYI